jgi:transposase
MKRPRKELSQEERGQIVGACRTGTRPADIARTLGFAASTVYKTINRYKRTGSAQPEKRPGRPKSLSERDQRVVARVVSAGRTKPLREIINALPQRLRPMVFTLLTSYPLI